MGLGRIPTRQAGAKRVGRWQVKVVTKGCWRAPWRRGRDGVVLDGATTVCFGFVLIGCFGMGCRLLGFLWSMFFGGFGFVWTDRALGLFWVVWVGKWIRVAPFKHAKSQCFFSSFRDHKTLLVAI